MSSFRVLHFECLPGTVVPVGATIAAIAALLVASRSNGVSTADAFTLLENNTGWKNGTFLSFKSHGVFLIPLADGWAFLLAFTAPMWCLTGCASVYVSLGLEHPVSLYLQTMPLLTFPKRQLAQRVQRRLLL